ncbi:hypothetical protein N9924_00895 [bacterium]|nr:hypothetical protein [bacterium]
MPLEQLEAEIISLKEEVKTRNKRIKRLTDEYNRKQELAIGQLELKV